MKKLYFLLIMALGAHQLAAQEEPSPQAVPQPQRWTFGGSLGFSGGSGGRFGITVAPRVGYLLSPELEVGVRGSYTWLQSDWYTSNQVGIGPFANYYFPQRFYLGAQFQQNFLGQKMRDGGPTYTTSEAALFLGGGYLMRLGGSASLQLGLMYNVLYKANSNFYSSGLVPSIGVVFGL